MTSLTFKVLRNVLSNRTDFCCLCYEYIGEVNKFVNIKDEVFFDKSTENMYEVLSTVLGDHVLDNIITDIVCLQCSETAINCYKFIQKCKRNIQNLVCSITSIQKHTEHLQKDLNDFQTLFLTFDSSDCGVESYYDKTKTSNDPNIFFEKIMTLKQQSTCIEKSIGMKRSKNLRNKYIQFSEIRNIGDNLICYKCKLCPKLCLTKNHFEEHYFWAHAPKDYKCPKCPKGFGRKYYLTRHMKDCHCSVVCSQCGKTYTNMSSLRQHENSHKLHFSCETCGKVYRERRTLINHINMNLCTKMRKSNAEAKFMCDYCDKKYAQKGALRAHISLQHMNGKAVTCDWCSKKFSSVSKLNEHIITHTKQKKFKCSLCRGKFGTKEALLYHTRLHTGEKPYKCEHCEETFISASRRSVHINKYHIKQIFECDICHRMYKSDNSLTKHKKRHFNVSSKLYCKPILNNIDENETLFSVNDSIKVTELTGYAATVGK